MQEQVLIPLAPNGMLQDANSRWRAIMNRNPSLHSSFLYGVKSTKIYCRPTCTARLARRANVIFFDTEDQARREGFRPCKRCKPDVPGFIGERQAVVSRVIALLQSEHNHLMFKQGLKGLADEVGVTTSYLCRAFKKTMGVTVGTYITEFEREPRETGANLPVQSLISTGSAVGNVEACLQAWDKLGETTTAPFECPVTETTEANSMEDTEEIIDFSFFLNDDIP